MWTIEVIAVAAGRGTEAPGQCAWLRSVCDHPQVIICMEVGPHQ
jgi:hypothetical protein